MGWTEPANPPASTCRTRAFPNEPGRVLAPTIATDRASSNGRSIAACASPAGTAIRSAYVVGWHYLLVRRLPSSMGNQRQDHIVGEAPLAGSGLNPDP